MVQLYPISMEMEMEMEAATEAMLLLLVAKGIVLQLVAFSSEAYVPLSLAAVAELIASRASMHVVTAWRAVRISHSAVRRPLSNR